MHLISLCFFCMGTLIGSFLNVCIYRIPRDISIAYPPSHCIVCKNKLKPYYLIPIISYIILKGKCRYCGEKISIRYVLIELLSGLVFLFIYLNFGFTIDTIKYIVLLSILIVVTFIDFEHSIIPGELMVFAGLSGIVFNILGYKSNTNLFTNIYGFLLGGGVILVIVLLTGGMGGGDIQLMAVIGLFLGLKSTVLTLILSFIIGAAVGISLIVLKKKSRKDYIPFGPWISAASCISIFWGDIIINWYLSIL